MIEFFFDCSSPWTWLAFHNLQPIARELGVEVRWRPVLVGGIFNAVNPSVYEFRERGVPAKQAYLLQGPAGLGAAGGADHPAFRRRCSRSTASRRCAAACCSSPKASWCRSPPRCSRRTGRATRTSRRTPCSPRCASASASSRRRFLAGIAHARDQGALKANTDEVIARGGFGSPTLFVGGDDMYFGNDRLGLVRDAVLRRQAQAAQGKGSC